MNKEDKKMKIADNSNIIDLEIERKIWDKIKKIS